MQFSPALLLLSLILPAPSFSQLTSGEALSFTVSAPAQSTTTKPPSSTLATLTAPRTQSSSSTAASSTAAALTSSASPSAGPGDTPDDLSSHSVVNYYFLLLALSIIIILAVLWSLHRRKKKNIARSRNSGHNALARDLEGWMGDRRWGQGGWGSGNGQRREEGLDERGEAPPPYMPEEPRPAHVRSRSRGNHDVQDVDNDRADGDNPAVGLSIPLHTLSRDERKPPDYEET